MLKQIKLLTVFCTVFLCIVSTRSKQAQSNTSSISIRGHKKDELTNSIPFSISTTKSVHEEGETYVYNCENIYWLLKVNTKLSWNQLKDSSLLLPPHEHFSVKELSLTMTLEKFDDKSTIYCILYEFDGSQKDRIDIEINVNDNPSNGYSATRSPETEIVYYNEGDAFQSKCVKDDDTFVLLPEKNSIEKYSTHPSTLKKSDNSTQFFCIRLDENFTNNEASLERVIYDRKLFIYNDSSTILFLIILTATIVTIIISLVVIVIIKRYRKYQESKNVGQNEVLYTEIHLQPAAGKLLPRHEQPTYAQIVGVLARQNK